MSAATLPLEVHHRMEDGQRLSMLVWRPAVRWRVAATSMVGGGLGERGWWLNVHVPIGYARMDGDRHVAELAASVGLDGDGVGMLTAVDVGAHVRQAVDGGVVAVATVGLGLPVWAASSGPDEGSPATPVAGTVNLLVVVPVPLSDAALVNAVATATEAKVQALHELGVPGTGTASDAVCIACPPPAASAEVEAAVEVEPFGGPRSTWGGRLARAVHEAVRAGARWPGGDAAP